MKNKVAYPRIRTFDRKIFFNYKVMSYTGLIWIGILCGIYVMSRYIYFNPTSSEVQGYYFVYKKRNYTVGDLVLVCIGDKASINILHKLGLPNKAKGECPLLLKKIVATKGDTVEVSNNGIRINKHLYSHTSAIIQYQNIRLNPLAAGTIYKLGNDSYFLLGQGDNSYDSRYFGVVKSIDIKFKAILFLRRTRLIW